jgi:hypothetical protein
MSDTNQNPQPIIDLILADINAVIPNLSSLVASYRLLVGASEEIHRTPEVCPDVFERAVRRADNAGTIIDLFLELLCCKVAFSSEFLKISCAPVDLFRLLANRTTNTDVPFHTAEQVVEMEALRRILERCHHRSSCLPEQDVICPKEPPSPPIAKKPEPISSDIAEVGAVALSQLINQLSVRSSEVVCPNESPLPSPPSSEPPSPPANQISVEAKNTNTDTTNVEKAINESRVRCRHLHNFHRKNNKPNNDHKK